MPSFASVAPCPALRARGLARLPGRTLARLTLAQFTLTVLALASTAGPTPAQEPQGPTVRAPRRTLELGLDAGAVLGLGDISSVTLNLPAARARVGFFLHNFRRWSVEPAALLSYTDAEDADGVLFYNLEAGALYHFRPPGELGQFEEAGGRAVAYARPFVNVTGATGGGDSEISLGAGLGLKVPWRAQLAWRFEANVGYGFDNEAARLGAFAGLSFFTRRGT
jgi:hypothetical protein